MRVLSTMLSLAAATALADHLRAEGHHVEHAANGGAALDLASREPFDIALVGPEEPEARRIDMVRLLCAARINLPVMVLPRCAVASLSFAGLDARMRDVVREDLAASQATLTVGVVSLDLTTREVRVADRIVGFTSKEAALLELLLLRQGLPLSKETLLQHLYPDVAHLPDPKIIDVFVSRTRRKLTDAGATRLIETAWGQGYVVRSTASQPSSWTHEDESRIGRSRKTTRIQSS